MRSKAHAAAQSPLGLILERQPRSWRSTRSDDDVPDVLEASTSPGAASAAMRRRCTRRCRRRCLPCARTRPVCDTARTSRPIVRAPSRMPTPTMRAGCGEGTRARQGGNSPPRRTVAGDRRSTRSLGLTPSRHHSADQPVAVSDRALEASARQDRKSPADVYRDLLDAGADLATVRVSWARERAHNGAVRPAGARRRSVGLLNP